MFAELQQHLESKQLLPNLRVQQPALTQSWPVIEGDELR
jgi:hypothetical protein